VVFKPHHEPRWPSLFDLLVRALDFWRFAGALGPRQVRWLDFVKLCRNTMPSPVCPSARGSQLVRDPKIIYPATETNNRRAVCQGDRTLFGRHHQDARFQLGFKAFRRDVHAHVLVHRRKWALKAEQYQAGAAGSLLPSIKKYGSNAWNAKTVQRRRTGSNITGCSRDHFLSQNDPINLGTLFFPPAFSPLLDFGKDKTFFASRTRVDKRLEPSFQRHLFRQGHKLVQLQARVRFTISRETARRSRRASQKGCLTERDPLLALQGISER